MPGMFTSSSVASFGNVPPLGGEKAVQPGQTHVAVGFADLGLLAAGTLEWPAAEKLLQAGCQPLRWVGYDVSATSVAKALVVAEMLRTGGEALTDAVLQVGGVGAAGCYLCLDWSGRVP